MNAVDAAPRYAVYFVPAAHTTLYHFGSIALGYDCYSGNDIASWNDIPMSAAEWSALTRDPRTYGFHATLKPPFRLRGEYAETDLMHAFAAFAAAIEHVPTITPSIDVLDAFVALVPQQPNADLSALADAAVRDFDRFRAPLTTEDRARRMSTSFSPRHVANLERWGYPYVFEDFRFHMTLTGRVEPERRASVVSFLHTRFATICGDEPLSINTIALLRQDRPHERFRVISHGSQSK